MVLLKSETKILSKGDNAPDFTLKNVDGKEISLSDFTGKPLAIIFMCNHCPFVVPKMDEIAELQDDSPDIVFLLINPNNNPDYPEDGFDKMQKLAKEKGYKYYLFDETQQTAKDYGAVCTPDPFLFDKDHRLVYHGRINDAMNPGDTPVKHELREAIESMLKGEEIADWFIPSQGCSIKWRE